MQSLRTRRPSQAQRKARPAGSSGGGASGGSRRAPGEDTARNRDARKSRVDDRIKKRMSMRYADISLPTDAMGVPAVPALPVGAGGMGGMGGDMSRAGAYGGEDDGLYEETTEVKEKRRMDAKDREMRMLDEKGFNPDACTWPC
jgi:hypothetical protein